MTYTTQQQLIDRFGEAEIVQLSDRNRNGQINANVVARALMDADALIDSYVGARYDLPLDETPPRLSAIAGDIAFFNLFRNDPPQYVADAYERALKALKDISNGVAVIETGIGGAEPARDGEVVLTSGPDRTFDRDKLAGY